MRAIVLLSSDGTICRKLHFNSIPDNYEVPEGTRMSVRSEHDYFHHTNIFGKVKHIPSQAHFFFEDVDGIIEAVDRFEDKDPKACRVVRITVQGCNPKNINDVYFYLLSLVQSDTKAWGIINHLNHTSFKTGFWKKTLNPKK